MQIKNFVSALKEQVGNSDILTDPADICVYSSDDSSLRSSPLAVVFATDIPQIQRIIHLCRRFHIPLTGRGGGTGTTGAALADQNGIILSLERMNRLLKMDTANRVMVVEPGITNETVQNVAQKEGFFWPPDPGSAHTCTIGGNLACNAAGPRAIKYGTTRENTLALTVVTGEGEILKTGTYTTKGAVGYDFTRLLIGSEGTLGIIVEATLKLMPLPEAKTTLRIIYDSMTAAAQAVSQIMSQPVIPSALEFIDAIAIKLLNQKEAFHFPSHAQAMLLIEVDGSIDEIAKSCDAIHRVANQPGMILFEAAKNPQDAAELWKARKALSPALRTIAPGKINEDVVVPVSKIPEFILHLETLSKKYQIIIVNFGHAGNGNIHVNLLIHPENLDEVKRANACLEEVFDCVFKLNGTLSGEHGIGLVKKPFIERALDQTSLTLMRRIKAQFDPDNILNPGKIFDL